jgi:RND family efflux transporter MFP subunit
MWVSPSFAPGGFFEHGTKLLKVDPYDYESGVIRAKADLARTKLRLAEEEAEAVVALKEWNQLGDGSANALTLREPQLADAKAAVAAAESNLETSRRNLERTEIRAPYSGRVRQKQADVGQFVTTGSVLASIYAVDYAEIRLPLTSNDLAYVDLPLHYKGDRGNREGPLVTLKAKFAGKEHVWTGRITRTEGEIDPKSRMIHAVAQVRNPYASGGDAERPPLAVGMYVEAEITGKTVSDVAVLPRLALRGNDQVLVVDSENRIRLRTVTLLRKTDTTIIVAAGLTENEIICLSLLEAVSDGMRVRTTDTGDIS